MSDAPKHAANSLGGDNTLAEGHPDAKMGGPECGLPRPESPAANRSEHWEDVLAMFIVAALIAIVGIVSEYLL